MVSEEPTIVEAQQKKPKFLYDLSFMEVDQWLDLLAVMIPLTMHHI